LQWTGLVLFGDDNQWLDRNLEGDTAMTRFKKSSFALAISFVAALVLSACSPEVGSKEWCEDMKGKDKGSWTANEAKDFAKHCVF
jgi:hypothetical protein